MKSTSIRFLAQRAASGIEYALLVGLVAVVAIGAIDGMGEKIAKLFALHFEPVVVETPPTKPDPIYPLWHSAGDLGSHLAGTALTLPLDAEDPEGGSITYAFAGGAFPPGLSLAATGEITGTPALAGAYSFIVRASDGDGDVTDKNFSLLVTFTAASCLDYATYAPETPSGVHPISVNGSTFDVYCDMTTDGGGWTMILAQFELDPLDNWNEGIAGDYDPTLASGKSFALSSAEIPGHEETGFGKNYDPTFVDSAPYVYTTGNIPVTRLTGASGASYDIHRDSNGYFGRHDPEKGIYPDPLLPEYFSTLTFDATGGEIFSWAFSPRYPDSAIRGFAMLGRVSSSDDTYGWTIWVR